MMQFASPASEWNSDASGKSQGVNGRCAYETTYKCKNCRRHNSPGCDGRAYRPRKSKCEHLSDCFESAPNPCPTNVTFALQNGACASKENDDGQEPIKRYGRGHPAVGRLGILDCLALLGQLCHRHGRDLYRRTFCLDRRHAHAVRRQRQELCHSQ